MLATSGVTARRRPPPRSPRRPQAGLRPSILALLQLRKDTRCLPRTARRRGKEAVPAGPAPSPGRRERRRGRAGEAPGAVQHPPARRAAVGTRPPAPRGVASLVTRPRPPPPGRPPLATGRW